MMNRLCTGLLLTALITSPLLYARAQTRRALIVTVAGYSNPDVEAIIPDGEQIDGKYMKAALQKQGITEFIELSTERGVAPKRFATRANILTAMQELHNEAKFGDSIVFYFSGHGGRRGSHFTLCPYDASPDTSDNDISDTDLANWIKGFPTNNITLMLDCCFNEYPTKDVTHRAKYFRRSNAANMEPLKSVFPPEKAVILKASRNDEEAQQENYTGTRPGKWVGVFTRWLSKELRMPNSNKLTYAQLMQRINDDVKAEIGRDFGNSFSQTPQIEGSARQQERMLFQAPAGSAIPRQLLLPPHLDVNNLHNGTVGLNAGRDQGVTPESEYGVYPQKARVFNKRAGKIRVLTVNKDRAIAKIIEGQGIKSGDAAIETLHKEHNANKAAFTLRVEGNDPVKTEMENALRATGLVTTSPDKPALLLQVEERNGELEGQLYRMEGANRPEATSMRSVSAPAVGELACQVSGWIKNLNGLRSLARLNNPNPGFTIKIGTPRTMYAIGEKIRVTIEELDQNGAHVDCYLTLIDIDANGAPRIIFPDKASQNADVRDNHITKTMPGIITLTVGPPTGQETLIAIATRKPLDWSTALLPSEAKSGFEIDTKGLTATEADVQDRPLNEWAKSIATFVIVEQAGPAKEATSNERPQEVRSNK